ncbi:hypothetical protein ACJX0J_009431, partial [Zea mays]
MANQVEIRVIERAGKEVHFVQEMDEPPLASTGTGSLASYFGHFPLSLAHVGEDEMKNQILEGEYRDRSHTPIIMPIIIVYITIKPIIIVYYKISKLLIYINLIINMLWNSLINFELATNHHFILVLILGLHIIMPNPFMNHARIFYGFFIGLGNGLGY